MTLKLRNGSKDMEHQLARSGGCIGPLLQADQIDLSAFEVLDGFRQILERPTKSIKSNVRWDHIILSGDFDWCSGAAERQIARLLHIRAAREWET